MHKDQLSFVTMTPHTDFLITSSIDGVVKFWKKAAVGIESVKEFRAHTGDIRSVSVSHDGRSFATAGVDKTIKIFDVITFGKSGYSEHSFNPDAFRSPGYYSAKQDPEINQLGTPAGSFATTLSCV